jgi:hypothetical protein
MAKQDLWTALFKMEYAKHSGVIPSINAGTDPARDLAIVQHVGHSQSYMLTYPLLKYDADYWNIYLSMFSQPGLDLHLSTALVISETLFGDRVYGLDIPDVWILSLEVLAQGQLAKII